MKRLLLALLALAITPSALAMEVTEAFNITSITVNVEGNLHFRVTGFQPHATLCPDSPSMAYLEEADSGSKAKIAALLSAYLAGKQVVLWLEPQQRTTGVYCHILVLKVSG